MKCNLFCCTCNKIVSTELVTGDIIYPRRDDLRNHYFWRCPTCKSYIGSHKYSLDHKPLGKVIPDVELRVLRQRIHEMIDPFWKWKKVSRRRVYEVCSDILGREYHTASLSTEEARMILSKRREIIQKLGLT